MTMSLTQQSRIRQMAAEGYSYREMSKAVGVTIGAVAGFCWRGKIRLPSRHTSPRRPRLKRQDLTHINNEVRDMIEAEKPPVEPSKWEYLPKVRDIPFIAPVEPVSKNEGCRFLHGEPREFSWCCQPIWRQSYCESHYRLTHQNVIVT